MDAFKVLGALEQGLADEELELRVVAALDEGDDVDGLEDVEEDACEWELVHD